MNIYEDKFNVTKHQVHFQPKHSSSSKGTKLKCTVIFLRVDNVQKKMQNIVDKFLWPFFINSVVCEEIWLKIFHGKIICWRLMEVKNHINNSLARAKRWPRQLNRGGR